MKHIFLFAILFFLSITVYAVANINSGKITGTILESETHTPVEYATITLYHLKDSTIINGTIADKNGKFEVAKIPEGNYTCLLYTSDAADE